MYIKQHIESFQHRNTKGTYEKRPFSCIHPSLAEPTCATPSQRPTLPNIIAAPRQWHDLSHSDRATCYQYTTRRARCYQTQSARAPTTLAMAALGLASGETDNDDYASVGKVGTHAWNVLFETETISWKFPKMLHTTQCYFWFAIFYWDAPSN